MRTNDNKLIAEFMGKEWHKSFFSDVFIISPSNITYKFDSDWNWLMEVVKKIEFLGNDIAITNSYIQIAFDNGNQFIVIEEVNVKIEATYNACVEFIKRYNHEN